MIVSPTYEYPASEWARHCLHAEQIFLRLEKYHVDSSKEAHWEAVRCILQLIEIFHRDDLRGKYIRFYQGARTYLERVARHPDVDSSLLSQQLSELDLYSRCLYRSDSSLKIGLRDNVFFSRIRQSGE